MLRSYENPTGCLRDNRDKFVPNIDTGPVLAGSDGVFESKLALLGNVFHEGT